MIRSEEEEVSVGLERLRPVRHVVRVDDFADIVIIFFAFIIARQPLLRLGGEEAIVTVALESSFLSDWILLTAESVRFQALSTDAHLVHQQEPFDPLLSLNQYACCLLAIHDHWWLVGRTPRNHHLYRWRLLVVHRWPS